MEKQLIIGLALLLLSGAPALAQRNKAPASVTPTRLPGEEKLSGQERAERDFLMPVRRKQAAALKALEPAETSAAQAPIELTARNEEIEEVKPVVTSEITKSSASAPRRTNLRRTSSSRGSHMTVSKRKVVHKSSTAKRKKAIRKNHFRRLRWR